MIDDVTAAAERYQRGRQVYLEEGPDLRTAMNRIRDDEAILARAYLALAAEAARPPMSDDVTAAAERYINTLSRLELGDMTPTDVADGLKVCRAYLAETARLRERQASDEDQLVWLAEWCRRTLGVENNKVIGQAGWPRRLVEVVAQAADAELVRLRADGERLREALRELVAAFDLEDDCLYVAVQNTDTFGELVSPKVAEKWDAARDALAARDARKDGGA